MAKKARKAKTASRKKSGKARKTKVQKRSAVQRRAPGGPPAKKAKKASARKRRGTTAEATVSAAVLAQVGPARLALTPGTKIKAVVRCVNGFLDTHHPGWDDDLQGDGRKLVGDFQEPPPLFLDEVNSCLEGKGFTIFPVPNALLQACATKTIGEIKFEINATAKPK